MRALLDVNVLLALFDASHEHHAHTRRWFSRHIDAGWASCAITQNGFVRIISQPAYPGNIPVANAIERLARATATAHHEFWTCAPTLCDDALVRRDHVIGHRQVTDAYLLALAVRNGGRFVTLDRRISLSCVNGSREAHLGVLG